MKGANHNQMVNNFEKGSLDGATLVLDKSGTQFLLNTCDETLQHDNDFNKNGVGEREQGHHNTEMATFKSTTYLG